MSEDREYINIAKDEYEELIQKLKKTEIEKNKIARELRHIVKRNEINKLNIETQMGLNKIISDEKEKHETYIRLFLESCPDPTFLFDEKAKFLFGAKAITDIIDIEDISILHGRGLDSIVERYQPLAFTEEILTLIRGISENGGCVQGECTLDETKYEVSTGDNEYEVKILPFLKDSGEFAGTLVIMHDITDIIRSKEIAERANMAKSEFLSRMSHEMRTPMNAIIGMTNIARESSDPEKKEYCLDKIDSASRHLLGVINDILDMSKIEANKFEISFDEFNFEKMLVSITNVINFRVEEKQQFLIINLDANVPETINCDELRLTQVITNLLTNAVKFTPEGGTITLSVRDLPPADGGSALQVEVEDTGIGIPADQQARLFSSFEQADGGTARKYGGTGLGLAISKRIVEMMGGKIWIESEPGRGAKFTFTIRYLKDRNANPSTILPNNTKEWQNVFSSVAPSFSGVGGFSGNRLSGKKRHLFKNHTILIAEDVEINREIMGAILEDTGVSIDFAENGREAVSLYKKTPGKYSLIFMDIQMPEMDGFEATRRIRSLNNEEASAIPIIAMTANVFKEDVENCLAAGMNGHLGKPIDTADLYEMLKLYL